MSSHSDSQAKETGLSNSLCGADAEAYGELHSAHCLDIYKLYVEMADRVSSRRQTANAFFVTVNTAAVSLVGLIPLSGTESGALEAILASCAGLALSSLWFFVIKSHRDLNSAKFKIIHEMEQRLPLRPYEAEWKSVKAGRDPKLYRPMTRAEMVVPWVFFSIHVALLVRAVVSSGILCAQLTGG